MPYYVLRWLRGEAVVPSDDTKLISRQLATNAIHRIGQTTSLERYIRCIEAARLQARSVCLSPCWS